MIAERLRKSILQAAIQGKLTEQLPEDGYASDLLAEIQAVKAQMKKDGKIKKEAVLSEITEDEIPFEIPDNWCWVRLGDIGETNIGLTYKPSDISVDGILVLRSGNIQKNRVDYSDNVYVSCEIPESKKCHLGDILICARNGSKRLVGKSAIIDQEKMTFGAFMALYRSPYNEYIHKYMSSPYFRSDFDGVSTTTINQITQNNLKERLLSLPPFAEQQRIVKKLDEVLAQIELLQKEEVKLDILQKSFPQKMKDSLLQFAIQGKLTEQLESDGDAQALVKEIQNEKVRLIKEKKIKKENALPEITEDEIPFDIPDSWCWVRFGDVVNYQMGKTPSRPESSYWANDIPWVSISDMIEYGTIASTKECVSQKAINDVFKNHISRKGTLIMSFKLTVGRVSYLGIDAVHNEAIISIFPYEKSEVFKEYLFKILPTISQWGNSKDAIKGKTLNSTSLSNMLFPLPPLAEQHRIVERLDQILPLCDALE